MLLLAFADQVPQIGDNQDVRQQREDLQKIDRQQQFVYFDGDIDHTTDEAEPFGPGATSPQAVALKYPNEGIGERQRRQGPQPGIGQLSTGIDEDLRIPAGGIQMQVLHKLDCNRFDVVMNQ